MSANISNRNNDKHRKQTQRRPRRGRLALALALALLAPAAWAGVVTPPTPQPVPACPGCLPEIGSVASGSATSNLDLSGVMNPGPTGMDTLIITQTTNSAIINWNTFNVASGFAVYFDQPSASSVTLNRVIGGNSSFIQGTINATGSVFLVNYAGILFGSGAQVNVGGLVASTLDITDANFLAGVAMTNPHYVFNAVGGIPGTPIVNQGTITADAGGTIALLAARIENQPGGTLTAPEGSVVFGAAVGAELDFYGDGLTTVTLTGNGAASGCAVGVPTSSCLGGIENSGSVTAAGGHVEMRTTTSDGLPQPVGTALFTEAANGGRIWIGGTVSTPTTATRTGSIILDAGRGNVDLGGLAGRPGLVMANATAAGQNAGTVEIDAYQLFTHVCVSAIPGNCTGVDSMGWVDATAQGAGGNGGQIHINLTGDAAGGGLYHAGTIQAAAFQGNAGLIDIKNPFGTAQIHNWILAESGTGNGGTINIDSFNIQLFRGQRPWLGGPGILLSQAALSAYGYNDGGTVNLNFNNLSLISNGAAVTPSDPEYYWAINVRGMNGNGGTVNALTGPGGIYVNVAAGSPVPWFVNASGRVNGGLVNFSAEDMQFDDTRFDVSGGVGSGTGNGGTIQLAAPTLTVNGTFLALGGTTSGNGGDISIRGGTVAYGGLFDTRAAGTWGDLYSDASVYLGVGGSPITVFAKDWSLYSGEVWVTTPAGFGSYSEGVVVTDAALAAAMGNGTYVRLLADNLTYFGGSSFLGNVNFVDFTSIIAPGSSLGGASFTALGNLLGNNFAIVNPSGLQFVAGGDIQFSDFTMNAGDVRMSANGIQLASAIVSTGVFQLAGHTGIDISAGSQIDALDIDLDATGSANGIRIADSTMNATNAMTLDAAGSAGIEIYNSTLKATAGVALDASNTSTGILAHGASLIESNGGSITLDGRGSADGITVNDARILSHGGAISLYGADAISGGISIANGARIESDGGAILLDVAGGRNGIDIDGAVVFSNAGDITLDADGNYHGINLINGALLSADSGTITLRANASTAGIIVDASDIASNGGAILLDAGNNSGGIQFTNNAIVSSDAGTITLSADGSYGGILFNQSAILSVGGAVLLSADNSAGGLRMLSSSIGTTSGDISLSADGTGAGVSLLGSSLTSASGDIEIAGRRTSGAGVNLGTGSSVNAGSGTVIIRAANDGSSDAIILGGSITSSTAVNLRPLDATSTILLGSGNGFALDASDFANIHTPWLVVGSAQQQGAINVISNIAYGGNLALQNQGGNGGIHLGAGLDVSGYTLALLSGGSIDQTAAGIIHAQSLLAVAKDDVLLAAAANDVTGTTLAGSAGGRFEYLDADALAIGSVSAFGFDGNTGTLTTSNGAGISATNVLIRTLSGNLTLNGNIQGADVDLVTAGVFLNPGGATITASNAWRVWASTWVGENRGGLLGSGPLPNLYNCTYGGACGVTVGSGNHFIYTQQPLLTISVNDVSREYGDSDPTFTYSVSGLIFADDNPLNVLSALLSSGTNAGSNVGTYNINGSFTSLAGYGFSFTPGTLTITPATLVFTADAWTWYMGMPFPVFSGTVTGFKNGDTIASYFGPGGIQWGTPAGPLSGPGFYEIFGTGFSASGVNNYVFVQAPGNVQALHILPLAQPSDTPTQFISEPVETFVYETNFETVAMCPLTISGTENELAGGDPLGNEWSKVRKRLNLVNCFSNDRRGGCGSF